MRPGAWYVGALLVSIVATLAAAWGTWRNRDQAGARPLLVVLGGAALWSGGSLAAYAAADPTLDLALNKLIFAGIVVVVNGYVLFTLSFIGRGDLLTPRTLGVLAVEPGLVLGILVYDPTGGTLLTEAASGWNVSNGGPVFAAHLVYTYLLIAVTTGLLFRGAVQNRGLYVWQFAAVLVGVFTPWVSNALFLTDVVPVDLTPVAFSVTGVALSVAIQRAGFMDVAPVAREVVVDTIDDAMLVVDSDGRVVDFNPAFVDLFGAADAGTPLGEALAGAPAIRDALEARADGDVVEVSTADGQRHLAVTVSEVTDHRGVPVGCVAVLHDVTEQQRRQRELERQNEKLDQFASLVSHDLRNPLNVASGRVELARETGDLSHLDDVEAAHARMQRLIEDVLALARQGQSIEETERLSLELVARRAWGNVETGAATLDTPTNASVVADESRLLRLFENLIRNAVEHSRTDVTVTVGLHDDGFYVADDGPGIPADERDAVFEAGYTEAEDGTGFGLAIVEEIAQAHGWSVRVVDGEDGGARFEFDGVECVTERVAA